MKYLVSWRWIKKECRFSVNTPWCGKNPHPKCTEKTCPLVKRLRKEER